MKGQSFKGQGMVEYALILALVAIIIIIAISSMGGGIGNLYYSVINSL